MPGTATVYSLGPWGKPGPFEILKTKTKYTSVGVIKGKWWVSTAGRGQKTSACEGKSGVTCLVLFIWVYFFQMDVRHKLGVTEGWTQTPGLAWELVAAPDSLGTAWMLPGLEVKCSLLLVAASLDPAVLCTTAVFTQTRRPSRGYQGHTGTCLSAPWLPSTWA